MTGWHSKQGGRHVAHYVHEDGRTACAEETGTQTTTDWLPLKASDHACNRCRRVHQRPCLCGLCTALGVPR